MSRFGKNKTTHYTDKLFDIISDRCKENALFCFVSHDNIDISAGLFFVWKQRIHYWSGANTEQGLKLGAPVFMFHEVTKHCIKEGIKSLDFNPSNNLKGVIQFKSKFGSNKLSCTLNSGGFH
jgi:lipid II:glycine glycyltransferase (peptidoglycan interpeptide bridge formation enzyme)